MKRRTTLYLEDDLVQMLKLRSIRTKQSMSDFVNESLLERLEEEEDIRDAKEAMKEDSVSWKDAMKILGLSDEISN